jgi:immune inhibitor A
MDSGREKTVLGLTCGFVIVAGLCLILAVGGMVTLFLMMNRNVSDVSDVIQPDRTEQRDESSETIPSEPIEPEVLSSAELMAQHLAEVIVPERDPIRLAQELGGAGDVPTVMATSAPSIPVGTIENFWVSNLDDDSNFQIEAEMVYATDHVYFWIEVGTEYEKDDLRALVDTFENQIYPTDREFFGEEFSPGIDGDEHLYILYADNLGSTVAGYFSSADSLAPQVNEYSNTHEMFYLHSGNTFLWEEYTYGVLAHEFQHMIHWARDRNEDTWMDEGFAELAVFLNGYDTGGFDALYTGSPDIALTYWPDDPGAARRNYGQAFLFITYFMDRFGAEATQTLIAQAANGLESMDEAMQELSLTDEDGQRLTADDIFTDWAVSLLLNGSVGIDEIYNYQSYIPPRISYVDDFTDCPISTQSREVNQYGIDYIRFACQGDYEMTFQGTSLVDVVPTSAHSGDYAFWSNRGHESDMTLTRAFDLSEVSGPVTFDYWVWYDIEENWDYLYLEASTDGGETWDFIITPSGTDEDPQGNSFGWAYTGQSGGGSEAEWIQESVDLSAYTGQEILLRFEYITDASVNGEGLLLDDLSIEALGYSEDFEGGDGGWLGAGFVRLINRLPQTYRLVWIERGDETVVEELTLNDQNQIEFDFELGGSARDGTLIVIGTTRYTWQLAPYWIEVRSQ